MDSVPTRSRRPGRCKRSAKSLTARWPRCWVAISQNGQDVYTSNAHSGTVSFYNVASDGTLTLNSPAVQTSPGVPDTDLVLTGHDSQLDVLVGAQVDSAAVSSSDGTLGTSNPTITGLPTGSDGLAATN